VDMLLCGCRCECGTPSRNRANGMDAMPARDVDGDCQGGLGGGRVKGAARQTRRCWMLMPMPMKTQIQIQIRAPKTRATSCWPCARRTVVGIIFLETRSLSPSESPLQTGDWMGRSTPIIQSVNRSRSKEGAEQPALCDDDELPEPTTLTDSIASGATC